MDLMLTTQTLVYHRLNSFFFFFLLKYFVFHVPVLCLNTTDDPRAWIWSVPRVCKKTTTKKRMSVYPLRASAAVLWWEGVNSWHCRERKKETPAGKFGTGRPLLSSTYTGVNREMFPPIPLRDMWAPACCKICPRCSAGHKCISETLNMFKSRKRMRY